MESFCVMGFTDVFLSLPKLIKLFWKVKKEILKRNPTHVVTIDYPGFNLRLQKALKKKGFVGKQIHYICPTVWAWGKKRIQLMENSLDLLLTILPFEPACFDPKKLQVEYVGHPLISKIPPSLEKRENILAIFPGSRKKEIERNLPLQLDIGNRLKKLDPTLEMVLSASSDASFEILSKIHPNCLIYPSERRYELMKKAKLALAKSGTVTLELALHETPTVVQYKIKPFDEFLATRIFKINLPFYSLPNLLLQKELFPELIGSNLTSNALFEKAHHLWFDQKANRQIQETAKQLRDVLGSLEASKTAANYILKPSY
jgi:lipid-A-disaccharide synthase